MKISNLIFVALIAFSCASQKSINYVLPSNIEKKIEDYLELYRKDKPNVQFYLTLDKTDNGLYSVQISEISTKSNEINSGILKKGNRYTLISNSRIPVVNSLDLNFIDLGKSPRGGIMRRSILNHNYGFYFNYGGDVIKEMK